MKKQFLITAFDFTDPLALQRRLSARPQHFEMMKKLRISDNFVFGGAMLDEEGNMCGSSLVVQFDNNLLLSAWLAEEPYLLLKVWEKVDIKPFKTATV